MERIIPTLSYEWLSGQYTQSIGKIIEEFGKNGYIKLLTGDEVGKIMGSVDRIYVLESRLDFLNRYILKILGYNKLFLKMDLFSLLEKGATWTILETDIARRYRISTKTLSKILKTFLKEEIIEKKGEKYFLKNYNMYVDLDRWYRRKVREICVIEIFFERVLDFQWDAYFENEWLPEENIFGENCIENVKLGEIEITIPVNFCGIYSIEKSLLKTLILSNAPLVLQNIRSKIKCSEREINHEKILEIIKIL